MIEVAELRKSFDATQALRGFNLQVPEGELFGLVGPNGAGKTTLIKTLATLLRPQGGKAAIAGLDVAAEPRRVRSIVGYMPDVPGLYHDMRVGEFLEFFADAFQLKGERKRASVERALLQAGLADRRRAFVERLSLGQKQRLILAKTLLHDPKVLLLDEPATGLDPLARIELREQLKALHRGGATILISSHILSDLEDICTCVAFIAEGRNASDSEGRSVLRLAALETPRLICLVEVLGPSAEAANAIGRFPGAEVKEIDGLRLRVEVKGSQEQAAALLRHLVNAGLSIVRFDAGPQGLEERYKEMFTGGQA
jgi:ABC-2 type transport system ATP-binding protein